MNPVDDELDQEAVEGLRYWATGNLVCDEPDCDRCRPARYALAVLNRLALCEKALKDRGVK